MQILKFLNRNVGVGAKSNKPYDLVEVSDGLSSFTLSLEPGIGSALKDLDRGDEFEAEVHVESAYGGLRGKVVKVKV